MHILNDKSNIGLTDIGNGNTFFFSTNGHTCIYIYIFRQTNNSSNIGLKNELKVNRAHRNNIVRVYNVQIIQKQ